MPEFTVENVIKETTWLAPELLDDDSFMEEWSQKYWGVSYKESLRAENANNTEA